MKPSPKVWATAALLTACTTSGISQTIFTYGNKPVSKAEFLKAYNKNNAADKPTDKSYRNYLDLYTRFKIKVQAAYDMKLDTLPEQLAELTGFRSQVVDNYMNDDGSVNQLVAEAAARARKDIHVAHIFIPLTRSAAPQEEASAAVKIRAIQERLQKGEEFSQLALEISSDPAVAVNKGDIGFITAFVLPYDMETAVYNTAPGKVSVPVRSDIGYHIFKNLGTRPAIGKVSVAQILIGFQQDETDEQKAIARKLADSLHTALKKGADFKQLVTKFSTDNTTYQSGGEIMEFGVGRYSPAFENAAFALKTDGELSEPFETAFGIHILKRLKRTAVPADATDKAYFETLRQQVLQSDRMSVAKTILYNKIKKDIQYKKASYPEQSVLAIADSLLQHKSTPGVKPVSSKTVLFTFANKPYRVSDWTQYLQSMMRLENMRHLPAQQLFDNFLERSAFDYYRENLEKYNPEFAYQLHEFKEGNLLFEVMQRKIWGVANEDSVGLQRYYASNKNKYWWEASADAVLFTAANESAAASLRSKLEADPTQWKSLADNSGGTIQADSGRFELGQIPVLERTNFTDGLITAQVKNENDNTYTFAYIIKVHRDRDPRSFNDARGFVVNDYQTELENKWIRELQIKYPVKVKDEVVRSLPK